MAQLSGGVVNANNIKLEPMLYFFGKRQRDCITALEQSGNLTGGEYFDFEVTDFDGNITQYRVWYDLDNGSVAPAAGGRTLVEVDIATGDSAAAVALASATALDLLSGMTSKVGATGSAEFYIVSHYMGPVTAPADNNTGFTFLNEDTGEKLFLGATQDATVVSFSEGTEFTDITANETGATLLSRLVTSVGATVSANLLELTQDKWASVVGDVIGNRLTPSGGTELVGAGSASIGRNLLTVGKELLLKPVNSGADNSRNLTFFKTAPTPNEVNYSGVDPSALSVSFNAYLDNRVDSKVDLWAFGDSFQDVSL